MVRFEPTDFEAGGGAAGDFLKGLAQDISENVCGLYQQYPRSFTGGLLGDSPVGKFNRGLWDSFCGRLPNPTLPDPPAPGFSGGQCPGVLYNVAVEYSVGSSASSAAFDFYGPIRGTRVDRTPASTKTYLLHSDAAGNPAESNFSTVGYDQPDAYMRIVSIARADGQPDNCGSVPADWPSTSAPSNNPRTYGYNPNDGGDTIGVNYDIDFFPDFDGPLVRLPDIPNICIGFNFEGIVIDLCLNKPGQGSGGDLAEIGDKLDQLKDIADRLEADSKENLNKEDVDETAPEPTDPEGQAQDGAISKCVPNLRFVKVALTEFAPNANVEVSQAGYDRIDDAGWFAFTLDGFFFPPQRIEFGGSIFEAPPGVECFVMQLRFGFKAIITTLVKDA